MDKNILIALGVRSGDGNGGDTIYTSRYILHDATVQSRSNATSHYSNDTRLERHARHMPPPLIYFARQDAVVARAKPVLLRGHASNARASFERAARRVATPPPFFVRALQC